jgi:hypothetical protein
MRARYDASEDAGGGSGPFVAEVDVIGLYRADIAATASRGTVSSISDNTHDVPDD